jgi:1-acyl-sn-glycerol-3-phosphate acyltransferase
MRGFLRSLIRFLFFTLTRTQIIGRENVPQSGAFVLASNHLGLADSLIVFTGLDRWDLFLPVAEKWQKIAILRWLGKYLNFLFVDRFNPDLPAIRKMIRLMQAGHIMVITPEGTRSRTGGLIEAKPGVSYLAAKMGYPVIPVALTGSDDENVFGSLKRFRRPRITVTAGKAFTLPPLPDENRDEFLKQSTDEIMCRIAALLPEEKRGVYADHPRLKELLAG